MLNRKVKCSKCDNTRLLNLDKVKDFIEKEGFTFVGAMSVDDERKYVIEIICPNGHKRKTSWSSFAYQKSRCQIGICNKTGQKLRKSKKDIVRVFEEAGYKVLKFPKQYLNNKTKFTIICHNKHRRHISYNHFIKVKECPDCNGFRRPYKLNEVKDIFKNARCEFLAEEYVNSHTPMRYKCVCGSEKYSIRLYDFMSGVRCQK